MRTTARAFAPATVANVAVGFDTLGFPIEGPGDEVTVSVLPERKEVRVEEIIGVETKLPTDPDANTATVGLKKLIEEAHLSHGFSVRIRKGIPLSSGMGGSAASAVAAIMAANELLARPLPKEELLPFALAGEAAASGAIHGDNVGPCLFGGLCLMLPTEPMRMIPIPVPAGIHCVLIHPDLKIETRQARAILSPHVPLSGHVRQSAWLAGFLAGCFRGDRELIRRSMRDVLIEPQRSKLITGFDELKARALELGALGFSISGSGPSVFAWADGWESAEGIREELIKILKRHRLGARSWISPIQSQGSRVLA